MYHIEVVPLFEHSLITIIKILYVGKNLLQQNNVHNVVRNFFCKIMTNTVIYYVNTQLPYFHYYHKLIVKNSILLNKKEN